jgi:hypothetical protein
MEGKERQEYRTELQSHFESLENEVKACYSFHLQSSRIWNLTLRGGQVLTAILTTACAVYVPVPSTNRTKLLFYFSLVVPNIMSTLNAAERSQEEQRKTQTYHELYNRISKLKLEIPYLNEKQMRERLMKLQKQKKNADNKMKKYLSD